VTHAGAEIRPDLTAARWCPRPRRRRWPDQWCRTGSHCWSGCRPCWKRVCRQSGEGHGFVNELSETL